MDYWEESVECAMHEIGISATKRQIEEMADAMKTSAELERQYTGRDVANANFISDEARELKQLKDDIEKNRVYIASTKPCPSCITTGLVRDGWGRDVECGNCYGEGRV